MICIITPAFNRAHTLARAYDSLKNQGPEFEWIVVDDASTDATVKLVEEWSLSDSRIRLIKLDANVGVNGARMAGVRSSTAPFIFFLDSDDELAPGALQVLEEVSASLQGSIGVAVFPTSSYNDENGLAEFGLREGQILGEYEIVCERVLEKELSYLYRRDVFEFQTLPEDMRSCEFLFVYGVSRRYLFTVSDQTVLHINRQLDNLSSSKGVLSRSSEIGSAYLKLIFQHRRILNECKSAKARYLIKSAIRSKMSGEIIGGVLEQSKGLDIRSRLILGIISVTPSGLMRLSDKFRIAAINRKFFGRD